MGHEIQSFVLKLFSDCEIELFCYEFIIYLFILFIYFFFTVCLGKAPSKAQRPLASKVVKHFGCGMPFSFFWKEKT